MHLLSIAWNASPELIDFSGLGLNYAIRWYSLLFALAFIVSFQIMNKVFATEKRPIKDLDLLTILMVGGTILGARIGHVFFYDWSSYQHDLLSIFRIWEGGLASHGAAIGIFVGLLLFSRLRPDYRFLWITDRISVVVAISAVFVRLGNFMNSEILGVASDLPWAVVFERVDMIPRHPAQLYEALAYLLIFITMKLKYESWKLKPGRLFGFLLTAVFGSRFFIEFVKVNQEANPTGLDLNMGQLLSIPIVLVGLFFMFMYKGEATAS